MKINFKVILIFFFIFFQFKNVNSNETDLKELENLIKINDEVHFKTLYETVFGQLTSSEKINLLNLCSKTSNVKYFKLLIDKINLNIDIDIYSQSLQFVSSCKEITEEYLNVYFDEKQIQIEIKKTKFLEKLINDQNYFVLEALLRKKIVTLNKSEQINTISIIIKKMTAYRSDPKNIKIKYNNIDVDFVKIIIFFLSDSESNNYPYDKFLSVLVEKLSRPAINEVLNNHKFRLGLVADMIALVGSDSILSAISNRDHFKLKKEIDLSKINDIKKMMYYLKIAMLADFKDGFELILKNITDNVASNAHETLFEELTQNLFLEEKYLAILYDKFISKDIANQLLCFKYSCNFGNLFLIEYLLKRGCNPNITKVDSKYPLDVLLQSYGLLSFSDLGSFRKYDFISIANLFVGGNLNCSYDAVSASLYQQILATIFNSDEVKDPLFCKCFSLILSSK